MRRRVWPAALGWLAAACAHPAPSGELTLAEQNYFIHCMGCHGENGAGLEGQVPDLRKDLARLAALPGGRAYILRVPGVTQTSLEPERTAEVLNYTLRQFGGAEVARRITPFTAAEVAAARAIPLLEISATRAGVIEGRGLP
ncbi:MAG: cytochrome C [Gemmatimonadetes bacterium]|nr:cytochrome C [Gemmatimonadota bacterium]